MSAALPPMQSVAYLVVQAEQNPNILNEFMHSFLTLRRFHPDIPVLFYHQNLTGDQIAFIRSLREVLDFPIAVDASGRFQPHPYRMKNGLEFPQLRVLAAKIDVLLLTPGDTLFLDTDTDLRAPLDEVLSSALPCMHASEGTMRDHERDFSGLLASSNWAALGWRGDLDRLRVFNSGAIWVPQTWKHHLYKAKEYMWSLAGLDVADRGGDNRLDEQISVSVALEEATHYQVGEVSPRVYHYWLERYENEPVWYREHFRNEAGDGVLTPPDPSDPEIAAVLCAPVSAAL